MEELRSIGLTDGEIKVYKAVLKLGLSTTGKIIKETNLQSSSTYHILDSLIEKGILSSEIKNNRRYFFAVSPKRLVDFIDDKKKKIEREREDILGILPALNLLQNSGKEDQQVLIFEGWDGMLSAFKEAYGHLNGGTTVYAYTITKEFKGADVKQVRWLINKVRRMREEKNKKLKKKILMRIIAEEGSAIGLDQSKTKHTKVRFIKKEYINPAVINIYGEITIIALWLKKPIAFYIISREVAESFKNNFDIIWKIKG